MITKLEAKNFRALKKIEIEFSRLTALVGPNGSGKTSVIRGLDLVLGEAWPSLRSFRVPQDFTAFDTSRDLVLTVHLNPPYEHEDELKDVHKVSALRVSCKEYKKRGKWGEAGDLHVDFEPLDEKGDVPLVAVSPPRKGEGPQFKPLFVSSAMRDAARIILIDQRRSLVQHLPGTRGSVLGRLLESARKDYERTGKDAFKEKYEAAMDAIRTDSLKKVEGTIADTAKRMLGFLGASAVKGVEIAFGFSDPSNPFNSLRLTYSEQGLQMPGEELGLGVQSAMVVGIFEALRRLGGPCSTIVIEEPEMYLHPQAQRYFFRLLCEMAHDQEGGCQVIYSTHSPIFADVNRFETLRLIRREPSAMSSVTWVSKEEDLNFITEQRERFRLAGRFDSGRNEFLFARRVLLTEGPGDRMAAMLVAEKLERDIDAEGCAIVDCGGKTGIPLLARLCRALGIPTFVMHDSDICGTGGIDDDNAYAANQRIVDALGDTSLIFVLEPSLEQLLGIDRKERDKPRRVVEKIQEMSREELPAPLVHAVKALLNPGAQSEAGDG